MKNYQINIKLISNITLNVKAKNEKNALKKIKSIVDTTEFVNYVFPLIPNKKISYQVKEKSGNSYE